MKIIYSPIINIEITLLMMVTLGAKIIKIYTIEKRTLVWI